MKKIILLIGIILLIQVINAEVIPLSVFSDKESLGNNNWKFTSYSIPQYYFNDLNNLNKIDSNFVESTGKWDYNVTKGVYKLGVKNDGTTGFRKNNKGLTMQLKGIGYYNKTTKQYGMAVELGLSEPTKKGNTISWQLPLDSNYSIVYEKKKFRDIIIMTQQVKNYLIALKPQNWNEKDIYFGLVYDLNAHNINLSNFDTNKRINFLDNNKTVFLLPSAKVYDATHYSGPGCVDNNGLEWIKHRVYFNGHYIEAIPFSALYSPSFLRWNATIQVNVSQSSDDAQETLLGIDLTNNDIIFSSINSYDAGVIFQNIDLPQGTTISEATLNVHCTYSCANTGNCYIDWWGADTDDIQTWSAGHKPSSEAKTTATVSHFNNSDFTSNQQYALVDLNVTAIVQEIFDRGGWTNNNNLGFLVDISSLGRLNNLHYKTYDYSSTSWTLTIEYSANPCQPTTNQNWNFTSSLYCYLEDINIGSGNLIIDKNGFLGLFASSLKGLFPFTFIAPKYWKQQYTYDSNLSVDSSYNGGHEEDRMAHNPVSGLDYHGTTTSYLWISAENSNDHWVEADLGEIHYCENVLFPISYFFNWFTDVNAEYYNGISWNLLYDNTNFQTTDCNWLGTSYYYCDLNLSINDNCSKVRYQVEHDSAEAGGSNNKNSILAMENIVIYDKYNPITKLTLFDSNIQIKNN